MRILDGKFRPHMARYVLQCLLATVAIMVVLLIMDTLEHTTIIASLGASAFIAFAMPEAHVSESRYLVGGYAVGIVVGACFGLLYRWPALADAGLERHAAEIVLGGLAVGCAIFGMVITNTEHPPAAGIALGLVVSRWDGGTLLTIFGAIVALATIRWLLRPALRNLL
ncbi:MAG: HPP family protein [Candidatus Brocadiia bacterium]